ncbi:MAG: Ig-like domain-containing protein [Pricia sp.]
MKPTLPTPVRFLLMSLLVVACTKQVSLYTEVEFELVQNYEQTGYLQASLRTDLSVVPEADLEGYSYSYSYEVTSGNGYFLDGAGEQLPANEKIPFDPLSASIGFKATTTGEHVVKIVASDNFGFTENTELRYEINDIPVVWTASAAATQVEPGDAVAITLTLENGSDAVDVSFESKFTLASGSGTLTGISTVDSGISEDFSPITPNTYALSFTADALGTTTLVFDLRDSNGQELQATVNIDVVEEVLDQLAPEITLLGVNPQQLLVDSAYMESGAEAFDAVDGDVTDQIEINATAVDTAQEGSYDVIYTVIDRAGNIATAIRTVVVNSVSAEIAVNGINVLPETATVTVGNTQQLTATIAPDNATNQGVQWSSSNTALATVDDDGLVTALSAGEVTITAASVENASIMDTAVITISAAQVPVDNISVNSSRSSIADDQTEQFTAVVGPVNASNSGVTWSSSNNAVANVDASTGMVTAVSAGTVNIIATATDGSGVTGEKELTVTASQIPVTSITVTRDRSSIPDNETEQFSAVVAPSNASNPEVIWSSSNEAVATVDASSGLVTAVSAGMAIIQATATDGSDIVGTAGITVTANQAPSANAGLDQTITLPTNSVMLLGSGSDTDGTIIAYQWTQISSSTGTPANIVSPSSAQTNVIGLNAGTYQFRLTVTDNASATGSATVTVTVNPGNSVVFSDANFYATGSQEPDADENFSVSGTITISGAPATFTVSATLLVPTSSDPGEPASLDNVITTTFTIDGTSYNVFKAQAGTEETETPSFPIGTYTYSLIVERQAVGNVEASWRGAVTASQ